ncbi:unnamed protein product [Mytilus edulis]|uniref:Uncharacterized protein n=1 Tax=Mytilus edulis TaxID=6550 RepID=A0A8S3TS67_MYTED|nr:unnamed protein product [Mytilus edulis]
MDKLPAYLVKSIDNACSLFSKITFTIHGDENKARISIMFGQSEDKNNKRKSQSMERRNNIRMSNFIQKVTKDNENITTNESQATEIIQCDQLMELENENVRSAETATVMDNIAHELPENGTMFSDKHLHKNSPKKRKKTTKRKGSIDNVDQNLLENVKQSRNEIKIANTKDDECSDESDAEDIHVLVGIDDVISKVVIKKSRLLPDKLIAKLKGTGKIIRYDRELDNTIEVCSIDDDYHTFKKNVEQDFGDVRDYEFRPDDTDEKVELMARFAFDNELFTLVK